MESGLAVGASVRPLSSITSQPRRRGLSIGQGWVVKVEEEET